METRLSRWVNTTPRLGHAIVERILMPFPDDSQEIRDVVCARYVLGNPLFWHTS